MKRYFYSVFVLFCVYLDRPVISTGDKALFIVIYLHLLPKNSLCLFVCLSRITQHNWNTKLNA